MKQNVLSSSRARHLLAAAKRARILVVGDVMLDQFIWGQVARISPEAPVPIVDFVRESFMPGGAANVARNLSALEVPTELFGLVGRDDAGRAVLRETLRLAASDKAFWQAAAHPAALAAGHGDRFIDYLKRVMLHTYPNTSV